MDYCVCVCVCVCMCVYSIYILHAHSVSKMKWRGIQELYVVRNQHESLQVAIRNLIL